MKTAYRTQQVTIDVVKPTTPPMVALLIQRLELDEQGEVTAITGNVDRIYRNALTVVAETVSLVDPITGVTGEVSIAGLEQILRRFANRWTAEEFGCQIDPATGWAVDCELK